LNHERCNAYRAFGVFLVVVTVVVDYVGVCVGDVFVFFVFVGGGVIGLISGITRLF